MSRVYTFIRSERIQVYARSTLDLGIRTSTTPDPLCVRWVKPHIKNFNLVNSSIRGSVNLLYIMVLILDGNSEVSANEGAISVS